MGVPSSEHSLEGEDAFIAFVLDLHVPHLTEREDAILQLVKAREEVAAPVVGDDGGGILCGREILQGLDAVVDGGFALDAGGFRVEEATIQTRSEAVELGAEGIEAV